MTLDGITLDDGFQWIDEYSWNDVAQTQDRSVTGALILQEQAKHYGRPISLVGEGRVWVSKADVEIWKAKEAELNKRMLFVHTDGREFYVRFNRAQGPAVSAYKVNRYGLDHEPGIFYTMNIKLITVEGI